MVYKFGGSSVATAERMLEVADIVCSFPEHAPLVVLSAMGKVSGQGFEEQYPEPEIIFWNTVMQCDLSPRY